MATNDWRMHLSTWILPQLITLPLRLVGPVNGFRPGPTMVSGTMSLVEELAVA